MEQKTTSVIENSDRRQNQRFVARRAGTPCFWISFNDTERPPLDDLSLEGFSMLTQSTQLSIGDVFNFVLYREGVPDEIRGEARAVNHFSTTNGNVIGCRFISLQGDGAERLQEWLVAHVIVNATIRITEKEALAIVQGRSLI